MMGRMNTGHKVSAVLHGGLILWVMLFDLFSAPDRDLAPAVADVSLVSSEEFAALSAPRAAAPEPVPEMAPQSVPVPRPRPEPTAAPEPAPEPTPEPAQIAPPEPIAPPPAPQPEPPSPPQAEVIAPEVTPDASLRPVQREAERVAPTPAPVPEPDVATGRRDQAAAEPDPAADPAEAPPAQEETRRAPSATETVTEATRISEDEAPQRTATAPEVSIRPQRRPARAPEQIAAAPADPAPRQTPSTPAPDPAPEPTPPIAPGADAMADAITDALAAALADEPEPGGGFDAGPSITQADIDGLRLAVEECWNVGILSSDALQVVVTIGFEMSPDAHPIPGSVRLVEAQGGGQAAQMTAFEAGRRAIEECGMNGFGLPSELYDQWRLVEITFNPASMSSR